MQKYLRLFSLSFQNGFVYRTSVFFWRLRQFLSSIMALTIWSVVFTDQTQAFSYDRNQMTTYIFLVGLLQSMILATALQDLATRVYTGTISVQLLKPVNIYLYLASEDASDKLSNVGFILIESMILYFLFQPSISFPNLSVFLIFLLWSFGGVLIHFFIQLLFGSLGFYSPEIWGPRFLFFMFIDFTAGKLYPLDILPVWIQKVVYLTPFPYLSFLQVQLFLQKLSPMEILSSTVGLIFWICLLGGLSLTIWQKSLKNYAAAGQ